MKMSHNVPKKYVLIIISKVAVDGQLHLTNPLPQLGLMHEYTLEMGCIFVMLHSHNGIGAEC